MEKYKIEKVLGDGAYGVVYRALNKQTGEIVAIKRLKRQYESKHEFMQLPETRCLIVLGNKCENLVNGKEIIYNNGEASYVFEYMDQNLYQFYKYYKDRGQQLQECVIKRIIYQVTSGLDYMHQNGYFHRDLKPENILMNTENFCVKLCDFGLARDIQATPPLTDYISTRWYRAPEILLKSQTYQCSIDIFALGCIMAELYQNQPLFTGKSELDQLNQIINLLGMPTADIWYDGIIYAAKIGYIFPMVPPQNLTNTITNASPDAIDLIKSMLQYDPKSRPTAKQIINHKYFKDVHSIKNPLKFQQQQTNNINQLLLNSVLIQSIDSNSNSTEQIDNLQHNSESMLMQLDSNIQQNSWLQPITNTTTIPRNNNNNNQQSEWNSNTSLIQQQQYDYNMQKSTNFNINNQFKSQIQPIQQQQQQQQQIISQSTTLPQKFRSLSKKNTSEKIVIPKVIQQDKTFNKSARVNSSNNIRNEIQQQQQQQQQNSVKNDENLAKMQNSMLNSHQKNIMNNLSITKTINQQQEIFKNKIIPKVMANLPITTTTNNSNNYTITPTNDIPTTKGEISFSQAFLNKMKLKQTNHNNNNSATKGIYNSSSVTPNVVHNTNTQQHLNVTPFGTHNLAVSGIAKSSNHKTNIDLFNPKNQHIL